MSADRVDELLRASRSFIGKAWAESFVGDVYDDGYADGFAKVGVDELIGVMSETIKLLTHDNEILASGVKALTTDVATLKTEIGTRVSRADAEKECRISAARMKQLAASLAEADGPTAMSEAIYDIPIPANKFQ